MYWRLREQYKMIYAQKVWGCQKITDEMFISDCIALKDVSFLLEAKVSMILGGAEATFGFQD